jgi:hypothetical protein
VTPLAILRGARELLAKPEAWTKGSCARNSAGLSTIATNNDACCFCVVGALMRVSGDSHLGSRSAAFASNFLHKLSPALSAGDFNDDPNTTHADILALLDKGIAQLEGTNA